MYQEIILDHYRSPHRRGLREPFDTEVHHVNPTCGDEVTLRVLLGEGTEGTEGPEGTVDPLIVDVSYDTMGCSISQASTSVMTDLVVGRPVADAVKAHEAFLALMQSKGVVEPDDDTEELLEDAVAFAGVSRYPARIKCALLGWMAWKDATMQAVGSAQAQRGTPLRHDFPTEEKS
jgi:nitrogen fixation NifU-like protein